MRRDYRNRTSGAGYTGGNGYSSSWNRQNGEEPVHDYSWKNHIYAKDFQQFTGNPEEEYTEEPMAEPEDFVQPVEEYGVYREDTQIAPEEEESYDYDVGGDVQEAESGTFRGATLLKFVVVFLILIYVMLLLIYTSGSTKPFQEVASAVEDSLDKEKLLKQDTQALKRYYGLNSADYEGVLLYSAEFSISAEEVLMIETKSEQQVQEVQDAIEERVESRIHTFEGYAPQQVQLLEQAQIQVRGNFIFLAVSSDAENYASVFTKAL